LTLPPLPPAQGGFPWGGDTGWIVADCTAEALKSLLLLQEWCPSIQPPVPPERLYQAVNLVSNTGAEALERVIQGTCFSNYFILYISAYLYE